jgi:hypothetical protein
MALQPIPIVAADATTAGSRDPHAARERELRYLRECGLNPEAETIGFRRLVLPVDRGAVGAILMPTDLARAVLDVLGESMLPGPVIEELIAHRCAILAYPDRTTHDVSPHLTGLGVHVATGSILLPSNEGRSGTRHWAQPPKPGRALPRMSLILTVLDSRFPDDTTSPR